MRPRRHKKLIYGNDGTILILVYQDVSDLQVIWYPHILYNSINYNSYYWYYFQYFMIKDFKYLGK